MRRDRYFPSESGGVADARRPRFWCP